MAAKQVTGSALKPFYDEFWKTENRAHQERHTFAAFQQSSIDYLQTQAGDVRGKKVLVIGPGKGVDLEWLWQGGAHVTAVDLAAGRLAYCTHLAASAGFLSQFTACQTDAHNLPFAAATFDVSVTRCVLMHTHPKRIAAECARVLKPGGRALFHEPLAGNPFVAVYRWFDVHRVTHPQFITLKTLEAMAQPFASYSHREFYLGSVLTLGLPQNRLWVQRLTGFLQKQDERLISAAPWLRRCCWITVATYQAK